MAEEKKNLDFLFEFLEKDSEALKRKEENPAFEKEFAKFTKKKTPKFSDIENLLESLNYLINPYAIYKGKAVSDNESAVSFLEVLAEKAGAPTPALCGKKDFTIEALKKEVENLGGKLKFKIVSDGILEENARRLERFNSALTRMPVLINLTFGVDDCSFEVSEKLKDDPKLMRYMFALYDTGYIDGQIDTDKAYRAKYQEIG